MTKETSTKQEQEQEPLQEQEQSPAKFELPKGGLRGLAVKIATLEMRISKLEERLN